MAQSDGVYFVDAPTVYRALDRDVVSICYETGGATIEMRQTAMAFIASIEGHEELRREIFRLRNQ